VDKPGNSGARLCAARWKKAAGADFAKAPVENRGFHPADFHGLGGSGTFNGRLSPDGLDRSGH
jgi:hypothetical protein